MDFLCLFPFHWAFKIAPNERGRYVMLLKIFRLKRAENLISVRKVTKFAQAYIRNRSKQMKLENPTKHNDSE